MVRRTTTRDGATLLTDEQSAARLQRLRPGVMLGTMAGQGSSSLDAAVLAALGYEIDVHGPIVLFIDGRAQGRLAPKTKELAVEWGRRYKGRITSHALISSKLIEMALNVIRMFVRLPLQVYTSEAAFLASIQQLVPELGQLPVLVVQEVRSTG